MVMAYSAHPRHSARPRSRPSGVTASGSARRACGTDAPGRSGRRCPTIPTWPPSPAAHPPGWSAPGQPLGQYRPRRSASAAEPPASPGHPHDHQLHKTHMSLQTPASHYQVAAPRGDPIDRHANDPITLSDWGLVRNQGARSACGAKSGVQPPERPCAYLGDPCAPPQAASDRIGESEPSPPALCAARAGLPAG